MKKTSEIKEAIISIEDGTVRIVIGQINVLHKNFHDRVSISFESNGDGDTEIFVVGHKISSTELHGVYSEYDNSFKSCCERLAGFSEKIETKKKFIWKKLKFEKYQCVWNHQWGKTYYFKPEFWTPQEYRANNWTINDIS